jgi:hypothetical protein
MEPPFCAVPQAHPNLQRNSVGMAAIFLPIFFLLCRIGPTAINQCHPQCRGQVLNAQAERLPLLMRQCDLSPRPKH